MKNQSWVKKTVLGLSIFFLVLPLNACKNKGEQELLNFLHQVDIRLAPTSSGQTAIQLSSTFNLGKVFLASIYLPIKDPKTGNELGSAAFDQLPNGQCRITIDIDTGIFINGDSATGAKLPNGQPIPDGLGMEPGISVAIPFMTASRIYFGGNVKKDVYIGAAFGIPELDPVMELLTVPADIFFTGNFGKVMAVGGVYGSPVPKGSGIAVFGKYNEKGTAVANVITGESDPDNFDRETQRRILKFFGEEKTIELK